MLSKEQAADFLTREKVVIGTLAFVPATQNTPPLCINSPGGGTCASSSRDRVEAAWRDGLRMSFADPCLSNVGNVKPELPTYLSFRPQPKTDVHVS